MFSRKNMQLWTRRAAAGIGLIVFFYVGFRIASHNGWVKVTHGARKVETGREPRPTNSRSELSLFVVGDTGKDSEQRRGVVSMMHQKAAPAEIDAVVLLGDNFYEAGVASVDDIRFQTDFEDLFDHNLFDCPFYVCLGNHDYQGNVDAQVAYQNRSDRWRMPRKYYRFSYTLVDNTIDFFVLDTIPIHEGEPSAQTQLDWLRRELSDSNAAWKIVIGHHPAISGGHHGDSEHVREFLSPLLKEHSVDLYLSGHDHDLQLNDSGDGWQQIVSGAGSKLRSTSWTSRTSFAKATPGFCWLLIRPNELHVSYYSSECRLFSKRKPCERRNER